MNDQTPFSRRGDGPKGLSKWNLIGSGPDAELGRLEAYCAEMNRRDPRKLFWFVNKTETGERYVDNRSHADPGSPRPRKDLPGLDWYGQ